MTVRTCFFRNQWWQHLISYKRFRNINMCLLEVAMCVKCRSGHFQQEGGSKTFEDWGGGVKNFRTGGVTNLGGGTFAGERGQYPIKCHGNYLRVPSDCQKHAQNNCSNQINLRMLITFLNRFFNCSFQKPMTKTFQRNSSIFQCKFLREQLC